LPNALRDKLDKGFCQIQSKGFLEQNCLHWASVKDFWLPIVWSSPGKSTGSPQRRSDTILGREPDNQYRMEQNRMELHRLEASTFCNIFFCSFFCLCNSDL